MFSFKFARAEKEGWVLSGFKKTDFLPPFGGSIKKCRAVKWVLAARAMPAAERARDVANP